MARRKGPPPEWGTRTEEETTAAFKLAQKIYGMAKDAQGYFDYLSAVENFQNDQRVRGYEADYSTEARKTNWSAQMAELHGLNREMQDRDRKSVV